MATFLRKSHLFGVIKCYKIFNNINCGVLLHFRSKSASLSTIKEDVGQLFIRPDVQKLLKNVTGFNLEKVFQEHFTKIRSPKYKLLTDQELKEIQEDAVQRGKAKLQMPPVLPPRPKEEVVLSNDTELENLDDCKYVFTDITYGLSDKERTIIVREPCGKLRMSDCDERDRLLNIYFPNPGRTYHFPKMFTENQLEHILHEGNYLYILDRACIQFEPDDPNYIKVCHKTYEHIADHGQFDILRSTRHFGPMTLYFAYVNKVEGLMADMIQRDLTNNAADVVRLHSVIHPDTKSAEMLKKNPRAVDQDIIQTFAEHDTTHGGTIQLALQAYLEAQVKSASQAV